MVGEHSLVHVVSSAMGIGSYRVLNDGIGPCKQWSSEDEDNPHLDMSWDLDISHNQNPNACRSVFSLRASPANANDSEKV